MVTRLSTNESIFTHLFKDNDVNKITYFSRNCLLSLFFFLHRKRILLLLSIVSCPNTGNLVENRDSQAYNNFHIVYTLHSNSISYEIKKFPRFDNLNSKFIYLFIFLNYSTCGMFYEDCKIKENIRRTIVSQSETLSSISVICRDILARPFTFATFKRQTL